MILPDHIGKYRIDAAIGRGGTRQRDRTLDVLQHPLFGAILNTGHFEFCRHGLAQLVVGDRDAVAIGVKIVTR